MIFLIIGSSFRSEDDGEKVHKATGLFAKTPGAATFCVATRKRPKQCRLVASFFQIKGRDLCLKTLCANGLSASSSCRAETTEPRMKPDGIALKVMDSRRLQRWR